MNEREAALFQEIRQFPLEDQPGPFPFSHRLARENGWSLEHAERVIGEYRKFLFLAAVSGKEVSPSDAVDQAWHLHLVYSRSYWDRLCTKVLKRPFHHEPAKGGNEDKKRFDAAYLGTLAGYRSLLGEEPPEDIWPPRRPEAEAPSRYERVDRGANVVIPRTTLRRGIVLLGALWAAFLGLGLTASSWMGPVGQVFDLPGPQFLVLYGVLFLSIVTGGMLFRRSQGAPETASPKGMPRLEPQEIALLSGGRTQVIQTVLTSLVQKEALILVDGTHKIIQKGPLPETASPLERALYREAGSNTGKTLVELEGSAQESVQALLDDLRRKGLVVTRRRELLGRFVPVALVLALAVFGSIKVAVGISRNRPVEILIGFILFPTVVSAIGFAWPIRRTAKGQEILRRLQKVYAPIRAAGGKALTDKSAETIPLAVALFGVGMLHRGALAPLYPALNGLSNSGGSDGTASSSGCGGGGCGGGGCGGGGCGGGGCGGCGGGS